MKRILIWCISIATALPTGFFTGGSAYAGDEYEIDPSHTHVQFSIVRFGFNSVIGGFEDLSGVIILDFENPEKSSVSAKILTKSLESGDATRNEHVAGPFWLNVEEFPSFEFVSESVDLLSEKEATVTGELTMFGVTRSVALEVRLNKQGLDPATKKQAVGFSATGKLLRSDFGLETALGMVADDVEIRIETLAHMVE